MRPIRFCSRVVVLLFVFCTVSTYAAVFTAGSGGTYSSIQAAINAAIAAGGDNEVHVRQGTYIENITIPAIMTSGILNILGGWNATFTKREDNPTLTTINGGGSNRVFDITIAGGTLRIDAFTITNGGGASAGAGLRIYPTNAASVEVTNNHITGNAVVTPSSDGSGGGLAVYLLNTSELHLTDNLISNNSAQSGTSTSSGGGMQLGCEGSTTFQVLRNVFSFNTNSTSSGGAGTGTLVQLSGGCGGNFEDNQVFANQHIAGTGNTGTGSSFWFSSGSTGTLNVRRNIWLNNTSHNNNLEQVSLIPHGTATLIFTDAVVAGDTGYGVNVFRLGTGAIQMHNLTIAGHAMTGLDVSSGSGAAELYNSIVYGNGTNTTLTGVTTGSNLIGVDPSFLNSAGQDFRLAKGSVAIDTGDNARCAATDVRGFARPADGDNNGSALCDIGAHEYPATTFADVPDTHFAFRFIEGLYAHGLSSGCGGNNYCPDVTVNRAQMAVFLERGMRGASYVPPPATGTVFNDVSAGSFAADYIEKLVDDGITSGCGGGNYCPNDPVSRAQMAVFLLRAKYGSSYIPPACSGTMFNDVGTSYWSCAWIEKLATDGITSGCGGGNYCPEFPVNRAQIAVFLLRTFNLAVP